MSVQIPSSHELFAKAFMESAQALEWLKSSYSITEIERYLEHVINMLTENLQSKEYDEPTFKNERKIKKITQKQEMTIME